MDSPVHSDGPQSQLDGLPATPNCYPALTPLPSLPAQDSGLLDSRPMSELLESGSNEAVSSDVRAPVIIDASPCPASSTGASSANVFSLPQPSLPAQDSGRELLDSRPMGELLESGSIEAVSSDVRAPVIIDASPCPASSTGASSANVFSLLQDVGSHQQQSGPTVQTSSPNHTTQSSECGSQSHNVLHPRGHGANQYSHRGRQPSRGNRHWNVRHTGFNGRNCMHTPPRGFPTPLRPFSPHLPPFNPWRPEFAPPPLWPPPGPVPRFMPPPPLPHGNGNFPAVLEIETRRKIVQQVEYYFSYSNLITDEYLRRRMDEQGFVPVRLIAGFPKIKQLTDNIQIVFNALRTSAMLEVQGDKVRSRFNWQGWRIPIDAPGYTVFREAAQN